MKLEQTTSKGYIFSKIYSKGVLTWLTNMDAQLLDLDYYFNHSGEKEITPIFEKLYNAIGVDVVDKLASIVLLKYGDNWNKVYKAYFDTDYKPLENYSMVEEEHSEGSRTETPDITRTEDESQKTSITTTSTNSQDQDVYGFNASTPSPQSKASGVSEQTVEGSEDGNARSSTHTESGTIDTDDESDRRLTRSGNIGVTTSQQMLESELELRKYDFYSMIMKDVDSVLCLSIY